MDPAHGWSPAPARSCRAAAPGHPRAAGKHAGALAASRIWRGCHVRSPRSARQLARAACFAVEGARAAHELLSRHGVPDERTRTVAESITLHLNITVPERLGAEAHLLSKGVSLDTVGRRAHHLPPASVRTVGERWPREGFAQFLVGATTRQAQIRPQSRSALLHRLGFSGLLLANPLDH